MNRQTRQLVQLITEDIPALVFASIEARPRTRTELAKDLNVSEASVAKALERLNDRGLANYDSVPTGKRGRPAECWRSLVGPAMAEFDKAATTFQRRVLRSQLENLDE